MMIKMPAFLSGRGSEAVSAVCGVTGLSVQTERGRSPWEARGMGGRRLKQVDGRSENNPDTTGRLDDATSYTQTQQAYLAKVKAALGRMEELALRASEPERTLADRAAYNAEYGVLSGYVREVAARRYNGSALFDGKSQSVPLPGEQAILETAAVDLSAAPYVAATQAAGIGTVEAAGVAARRSREALEQAETDWRAVSEGLKEFRSVAERFENSRPGWSGQAAAAGFDADSQLHNAVLALRTEGGAALSAQANALPQMVMRLV